MKEKIIGLGESLPTQAYKHISFNILSEKSIKIIQNISSLNFLSFCFLKSL